MEFPFLLGNIQVRRHSSPSLLATLTSCLASAVFVSKKRNFVRLHGFVTSVQPEKGSVGETNAMVDMLR